MIWKDAVEYLHEIRPELSGRLPSVNAEFVGFPGPPATIDATRAKEALKMDAYIDWKQTIVNTVDTLLDAEKAWDGKA